MIRDALRRAPVKRITCSLQPRHGRRVGVTGPDIQQLTFLARLVRVQQPKIPIEAFVDRCRRRDAARCDADKAEQHNANGDVGVMQNARGHIQTSLLTDGGD